MFLIIFLANDVFHDTMPIKQFFKKKNIWYERYVNFFDKNTECFQTFYFL